MVPRRTIIYNQQADIKCYRAVSVRIENAAQNTQGLLHFVQQRFVKSQGHSVCALPWRVILKGRRDALDSSVFLLEGDLESVDDQNVLKIKEWLRKKKEGKQSKAKLIDVRHGSVVRRKTTFQNKQVRELFPYLDVFSIKIELISNTSGVGATVKGWLKS